MKSNLLRSIVAFAVMLIVTVGFVTTFGVGTVSAFGWLDLSLLCPLGALTTLLASKMMVPRVVISGVFAVIFILIFGRAFCAWICPVPLVQKVRGLFAGRSLGEGAAGQLSTDDKLDAGSKDGASSTCSGKGCASCGERLKKVDSRHFILGGSLLSAALFGFPVFCLICPIGLSFASILLVIRLFSTGDVSWTLPVVVLLLLVEVVFFKKWCSKLCPLSAFMSILGYANRTFRPRIDTAVCKESAWGSSCGVCAKVCPEGIDPRLSGDGTPWNECTKCRRCIDACPAGAIKMPLLPQRKRSASANT